MREGSPEIPFQPEKGDQIRQEIDALLDDYYQLLTKTETEQAEPNTRKRIEEIRATLADYSKKLPPRDRLTRDERALAEAWSAGAEGIEDTRAPNERAAASQPKYIEQTLERIETERPGLIDRLIDEAENYLLLTDETNDLIDGLLDEKIQKNYGNRVSRRYQATLRKAALLLGTTRPDLFQEWQEHNNPEILRQKLFATGADAEVLTGAIETIRSSYEKLLLIRQEIKSIHEKQKEQS